MNLKKAKNLRTLVFGNKSIRHNERTYAQTNKCTKHHSLADIAKLKDAKKEVEKSFISSTAVAVKLRAQYQRLKKRIIANLDENKIGVAIPALTQKKIGKLRSKTEKNRDKRARKQLKFLIS